MGCAYRLSGVVLYPVSLTKYSVQCSVSVTPVCPVPLLLPGREKTLGPGRETRPSLGLALLW